MKVDNDCTPSLPPSKQQMVSEFMREFKQPVRTSPTWLTPDEIETRMRLIIEESNELNEALISRDIYEIADGIGDLLYVVYGTACSCGIDIDPIFAEIHRSNMTKRGGHINEYGKLVKPPTYEPPKLLAIIDEQIEKD